MDYVKWPYKKYMQGNCMYVLRVLKEVIVDSYAPMHNAIIMQMQYVPSMENCINHPS